MKTISMKDIINGQKQAKVSKFNTDLFKSDVEHLEASEFNTSYYDSIEGFDSKSSDDSLEEVVVATKNEDAYLITVKQTSFNGEKQINVSSKELTLQGFNYFTKDIDRDYSDYYNMLLISKGYEIELQDILDLGELSTEYNTVTLSFMIDETKHWLTVNSRGQLSKITKREPNELTASANQIADKTKVVLQSIFG